jgi:hypothetical protein
MWMSCSLSGGMWHENNKNEREILKEWQMQKNKEKD